MSQPRVAVIGAGSWGTALANLLAKKGVDTVLWSYEADVADAIEAEHRNPRYLSEIFLDPGLRVTRSMRKSAKRYNTTVDAHFTGVLAACADSEREGRWIDERIETAYTALHHSGYVHSVETWDDEGRLVGGLYAVHQNGLVAGESMFHHPQHGRDASKVALMRLVVEMRRIGAHLLDVQWLTPHLESLGARELPRHQYLRELEQALGSPHNNAWNRGFSMTGAELLEQLDER